MRNTPRIWFLIYVAICLLVAVSIFYVILTYRQWNSNAPVKPINPKHLVKESIQKIQHALHSSDRNVPIQFAVKAVDPDGIPIQGVSIEITTRTWVKQLASEDSIHKSQTIITDEEGLAKAEPTEGSLVTISRIYKDGYISPLRGVSNFFYTPFGNPNQTSPSPQAPAAFVLYPFISDTVLKRFRFEHKIHPGTPKAFWLTDETNRSPDLVVTVERPPEAGRGDRYNWSYKLDAKSGGIQKCEGDGMVAPLDGYQKSLIYHVTKDSLDWSPRQLNQLFCLKTEDGKYAAFYLNVFGFFDWASGVFITGKLNLSGSRNVFLSGETR